MQYVVIIGAKSLIAQSTALYYAQAGFGIIACARDTQAIALWATDMAIRNSVDVVLESFDVEALESHATWWQNLSGRYDIAGVITVAGFMPSQAQAQEDWSLVQRAIVVNYMGLVSLLNHVANSFEARKEGFIVGVSSVAGNRGRKTNYLYGSAKAGFSAYLSGLRNRLSASGVHVLTVLPGFVYTPMTQGLALPKALTAHPDEVGAAIYRAQQKGCNILYVRSVWRIIMLIIAHIPETIFKRMSL
ncbi:MAG: short-chain dehydrogenase [Sulfuricurvum sp. PC08-66]|nr:MAG: short-chain dehydrogenase [Sulfuricurvum sp. PC08-66]